MDMNCVDAFELEYGRMVDFQQNNCNEGCYKEGGSTVYYIIDIGIEFSCQHKPPEHAGIPTGTLSLWSTHHQCSLGSSAYAVW